MKNPEVLEKYMKNSYKISDYKDTNLYYQGSYELDFLEKYYNNMEIVNGKTINYIYENNNHSYLPDFYLPKLNLIIEIKSEYIYNLHLNKNLLKKQYSLSSGYNFLFIIDKNYEEFEKIIKNHEKQ